MPTLDTFDQFSYAYTAEYLKYLQHLELPVQYRLPKPPWYRKYIRRKFRLSAYEHALDNFLHIPRKDKPISENVLRLKAQGIKPKRILCPTVELEPIMQSKTKNWGRYEFIGIVSVCTDTEIHFAEIIQQLTGRELEDYVLKLRHGVKLKAKNFAVGDIVAFKARLHQTTTGYVNYTEGINDSEVTYKLTTTSDQIKIN